jgi:hypothetical protein
VKIETGGPGRNVFLVDGHGEIGEYEYLPVHTGKKESGEQRQEVSL